jgi:hypothetical protein
MAVSLKAGNCYGIKLTITCDSGHAAQSNIIVNAPTVPAVPAMALLPATALTSRGRSVGIFMGAVCVGDQQGTLELGASRSISTMVSSKSQQLVGD